MTKISDFITVVTGYANQVHLVDEFTDSNKNRDRMLNYRPIKSHRTSFRRIALSQKPTEEKCFLMTGSYGTGKSHLALMLANYFSLKPDAVEMVQFYSSWEERDSESAQFIKDLRGGSRYLVALGEYGQGKDFEEMILDAIQEALRREGNSSLALDSHYKEAVRQIERWEARQKEGKPSGTLLDFIAELEAGYPGRTLEGLKRDLSTNDAQAMADFRDVYRKVIGRDFDYSKDNLIDILTDLMSSPDFSKFYKGLVIIADEFGYILDHARLNIDIFQRFAETCRDGINGRQLIFIGTGHKSFNLYGTGRLAQADFRVVSDRVKEVPLEVEEIEQIIGALIKPDTASPAWKSDVEGQSYWTTNLARQAREAGIFPHLGVPKVLSEIVQGVYPMHPMAVHCLIRMSIDMGSNARSVFTFFTGGSEFQPADGSYPQFIQSNDSLRGNRPNLYTADQLTNYFEPAIRPENTEVREAVRGHIRNYQASREEALRLMRGQLQTELDPLEDRLLRLMLVYKICDIPTNLGNLSMGLYCMTPAEKTQLENLLTALRGQKVLYCPPNGLEYEFRRSDSEDFEGMIAAFKGDPKNRPADMAKAVGDLVKFDGWLDAKGYNGDYAEDKRMQRLFVRPGDLTAKYTTTDGKQIDFWAFCTLRQSLTKEWKDRFEGVAVYILCESAQDVTDARAAISNNPASHIITGVPGQPILIEESVMDLLAVRSIEQSEGFKKFSIPDQMRLRDELLGDETKETGFVGSFIRARRRYLEGKELSWFGKDGKSLLSSPKTEYEPADVTMRLIYTQRNKFSNQYLNPAHGKASLAKDAILGDAIRSLVEFEKPLTIDRSVGENRAERRYLDTILATNEVLRLVGPYNGTIGTYQIETNLAKYKEKLPALAELIVRLKDLQSGKTLSVHKTINEVIGAPYGQGPVALALYLACTARYFGDELRLKLDPAKLGYASLANANIIFDLVGGLHPSAQFERTPISQPRRELLNGVYDIFSTTPQSAVAIQRTVGESWSALKGWWDQRKDLEKCEALHTADSSGASLIDFSKKHEQTASPHQAVLNDLPVAFGVDDTVEPTSAIVSDLLQQIRDGKLMVTTAAQDLKDGLLDTMMHEFAPDANQYTEYLAAINTWYAGLDLEQRDLNAAWQTPASKSLLRLVPKIESLPKAFLEVLPAEDGYVQRAVDEWVLDRSTDYHSKLVNAKSLIDKHAIRVPAPLWEASGDDCRIEKRGGGDQVYFRGKVSLKVTAPAVGITVYVVQGNDDPRIAAQRLAVTVQESVPIEQDCTIRLVARDDASQEFGKIIDIALVNEDRRYAPVTIRPTLDPLDREYNFVYPKDRQALHVFLKGFVQVVLDGNKLSKEEILAEFQRMLDEGAGDQ